jgi:hypothetical protein
LAGCVAAAVLCCAVLCCAVLCCAVLCCAVLCCAVLCCCMVPARPTSQAQTDSNPLTLTPHLSSPPVLRVVCVVLHVNVCGGVI